MAVPPPIADLLSVLALLLALPLLARSLAQAVAARLGWRAVVLTTGWIGVPVHESAHLLACWLTRRPVREVRWLAPDPAAGTLGHVAYEPGRGPLAWLAGLCIGLAPLVAGATVLQLGLLALNHLTDAGPPAHELGQQARQVAQGLQHLWRQGPQGQGLAVLGVWICVAVAAHAVPSRADLAGAWRGGLLLLVLFTSVGLALRHQGVAVEPRLLAVLAHVAAWLQPPLALAAVLLAGLRLLLVPVPVRGPR